MPRYPYMNRGSYEWVPDTYASTTGSDFGVMQAYYPACIDFGRPQNALPPDLGGYAAETLVYGLAIRDKSGAPINGLGEVSGGVLGGPFLRSLMRSLSTKLDGLPDGDPVGISSFDYAAGPYYLFSVDKIGTRRFASILVDYVLYTSEDFQAAGGQGDTPLSIIALFDAAEVGAWYSLSRSDDVSKWGPPAEEKPVVTPAVARASELLGHQVMGLHIPIPRRDSSGKALSIPELNVTHPGEYGKNVDTAAKQPWSSDNPRTVSIRLDPRYFIDSGNFPKLRGILIAPNEQVDEKGVPIGARPVWNAVIRRIRVYDAIQSDVTPTHSETSGDLTINVKPQFPCKIFGYAWRIQHPVEMSMFTAFTQPSLGRLLAADPKEARRDATIRFKLFHPDFENLGIAHSIRFYYGLAVAAIPLTSAFGMWPSLTTLIGSLNLDMDLLLVQYTGPLAGHQSLTLIPSASQIAAPAGRVVWGGQFGYSRQTVALKCFAARSSGIDPPTQPGIGNRAWADIGVPRFPASTGTGLGPLWYHDPGDSSYWYTFLSMDASGVVTWNPDVPASYAGGFTTTVRGGPQTHVSGLGAFSMTVTDSETFSGSEITSVYAKARNVTRITSVPSYCSGNMDSHLATFVSEARNLTTSPQLFAGTWRIRFAASVSEASRDTTYVFYRFAFVSTNVPDANLNGDTLWTYGPDMVQEFHFESSPELGGFLIAAGPPDITDVTSTFPLSEQPIAQETSVFCVDARGGDHIFDPTGASAAAQANGTMVNLLERTIDAELNENWAGGVRIAVQAWAVSYAVPGAVIQDPLTATQYPTVTFSWGGGTDAMIQTMITDVRSGTILTQQDPIIARYLTTAVNTITMREDPSGQDVVPPTDNVGYRNYPLYNQYMVLGTRFDTAAANRNLPSGAEAGMDLPPVGLSIVGIAPKNYYDPLDDVSQVSDTYVDLASGSDAIIGGSGVLPQAVTVRGSIGTNVSTFDAWVSFEVYIVSASKTVAFQVCRTPTYAVFGTPGKPLDPSESTPFELSADIPLAMTVPDLEAQLMLRCRVWSRFNDNSTQSKDSDLNVNPSKMILDIGNFEITFEEGLAVVSDEQYLLGNNNWYQDLPMTTARTFGAAEYFFVPDDDVLKQAVMPPLTTTGYGYFNTTGWLFSPFWYIDIPEGGVFEIQDRGGLTQGNMVTGNAFIGDERYQKAVWVRTAVDTVPSTSVSSTRGSNRFGPRGFIARSGQDASGTLAGASMGVIPIQDRDLLHGLVEYLVRAGETLVTGKNPLIVAADPDAEYARHLRLRYGKMNPQLRFLFYEDDEFDSAAHQASVVMLTNYDGSGIGWKNPYGANSSGGQNKVVMTNDMKMLGAAVDPLNFTVYVVGYRSTDPNEPQKGGMIVMRSIRPALIFGTDSAATGPLHYVDGMLTEADWSTSSLLQPLFPLNDTGGGAVDAEAVIAQRPNKMGSGGTILPALESFPDLFVDANCNIFVFYTLLSDPEMDRSEWGAMGKIFCRRSTNGGYFFEPPFPVTDLGYLAATKLGIFGGMAEDGTFEVRHVVSLYDDISRVYILIFWAGGKVFMRIATHPDIPASRVSSMFSTPFSQPGTSSQDMKWSPGHRIYMIAGSTDFIERQPSSMLDRWLYHQFQSGDESEVREDYGGYDDGWSNAWEGDGKKNNYNAGKTIDGKTYPRTVDEKTGTRTIDHPPLILINRFSNDPDVPPQRVSAFVTSKQDLVIVFMDALYQLMYKRVRISGKFPVITPAVKFDTNVL